MAQAPATSNVVRIARAKPSGDVAAALAALAGDDTIRVLYRVDDESPGWVGADGARTEPVAPSAERAVTAVELGGVPVAIVEHAAGMPPEAISAACTALAAEIERES